MSAAVALAMLLACGAKAPPHAVGTVVVTGAALTADGVSVALRNDGPRAVAVVGLALGLWDSSGPAGRVETDPDLDLPPGQTRSIATASGAAVDIVRVTGTVRLQDPRGGVELLTFDLAPEAP